MASNLDLLGVSRTDRHVALNATHDPQNLYITRGYPLWPKKRFFRSYSVPALKEPPSNGFEFTVARQRERFEGDFARSLTGWVNFANVLHGYGIRPPSTGELIFSQQEALLPVHRGWLLLLAIIDRYSDQVSRPDKGLFDDEAEEPEMGNFNNGAIFGVSGIIERIPPSPHSHGELESGPQLLDKVAFRMHSPEHMAKIPEYFSHGDTLRSLAALFLGYLMRADGEECYGLEMPGPIIPQQEPQHGLPYSRAHRSPYRLADNSYKIWVWDETTNNSLLQQKMLFQEVGIQQPPRMLRLKEIEAPDEVVFSQLDDNDTQNYRRIADNKKTVWIARSSLHVLLYAVLQLKISRQSFLCGSPSNYLSILYHLFDSRDLRKFLEKIQSVVVHLPSTQEEKRDLERSLLSMIAKAPMDGNQMSWSRTRMDASVDLDKALDSVCRTSKLLCQTVAILYMQEENFRKICKSYNCGEPATVEKFFLLDPSSKKVVAPSINFDATEFYFDFSAVFSGSELAEVWSTPMNQYPKALPLPQAMIACLQGHLRMAIWDMKLPALPLANFYASLCNSVVYIAPQETPSRSVLMPTSFGYRPAHPQHPTFASPTPAPPPALPLPGVSILHAPFSRPPLVDHPDPPGSVRRKASVDFKQGTGDAELVALEPYSSSTPEEELSDLQRSSHSDVASHEEHPNFSYSSAFAESSSSPSSSHEENSVVESNPASETRSMHGTEDGYTTARDDTGEPSNASVAQQRARDAIPMRGILLRYSNSSEKRESTPGASEIRGTRRRRSDKTRAKAVRRPTKKKKSVQVDPTPVEVISFDHPGDIGGNLLQEKQRGKGKIRHKQVM
ncbi:hypothetical protein AJ79_07463 [Helicocarpus griseus UAMH5409]|uniref:Uncharacterized protein n=1 Tax=Helicocarpus griseus UAMH5409 TaxID=1447875 RepID=A0A2B7X2M4_9EURO|nr:hypothetical protein AJ79_07463 [Helicocarpus griseus UAMH5409]